MRLTTSLGAILLGFAGFVMTPEPGAAGAVDLDRLIKRIGATSDEGIRLDLVRGLLDAAEGRRRLAMPAAWPSIYPSLLASSDPNLRGAATRLALAFGDPTAFARLREVVADSTRPNAERVAAIESLARARDGSLPGMLLPLLADRSLRSSAIRGLSAVEDAGTPEAILAIYGDLDEQGRVEALETLSARPGSSLALLAAIQSGRVPRSDLTPAIRRNLSAHDAAEVRAALGRVASTARSSSEERKAEILRLKSSLDSGAIASADRSRGRALFDRACSSCHTLFGSGGKVGPELTGAQRADLDYVLSNVVDPSAIVPNEYRVAIFETNDGRVISGIVRREDERSVVIQTIAELITLPKSEVESRKGTSESMMPEGLIGAWPVEDVRDLVAYLASPGQVPPTPSPTKGVR